MKQAGQLFLSGLFFLAACAPPQRETKDSRTAVPKAEIEPGAAVQHDRSSDRHRAGAEPLRLAEPKPGTIVDEVDIDRVTAQIMGETPEFVVEGENIPKLLRCLRLATRCEKLDHFAPYRDANFIRVVIHLKNQRCIIIETIAVINGPLLFAMNGVVFVRTTNGKYWVKGDHASVYGHPEMDMICEFFSFKELIKSMYKQSSP